MGSLTASTIEKVLKHLVGKESFTVTPYLGLFTTKPTESTAGVEVLFQNGSNVNTGYARVSTAASVWTYDSADRAIKNNADIIFPNAALDWGTVVAVGLFNSATSSDLLWYSPLSSPITVRAANTLGINSNTLSLEFTGVALLTDAFDFDTSANYTLEYETSLLKVEKSFDTAMGYKDTGALRVSVTDNIATGPAITKVFKSAVVGANNSNQYTVSAAARTTNTNLVPRLVVQCMDPTQNITLVIEETVSTGGSNPLLLDRWQTRTVSFTSDVNTAYLKVGFYVEATQAAQTGTVWFDNLRVAPTS